MARKRVRLTIRRKHQFTSHATHTYPGGVVTGLATGGNSNAGIYDLVEAVPECNYLAKHQATQVSRGDLLLMTVNRETGEETRVEDETLNDLLLAPLRQSSTGGIEEYMRRAALHLTIAGEYLHAATVEAGSKEVTWAPYAMGELTKKGSRWEWKTQAAENTPLASGLDVLRCYRPAAANHTAADSPAKDVSPILEDLVLIQQLIRTLIKMRLNAGILLIPDGVTVTDDTHDLTQDGSTQDRDDVDELTEAIVQHITTPISDPSSAASVAPMILVGPQEALEAIRLLSLGNQDFGQLVEWRRDTIVRLGQAWDAPPEQLQGKGGLNHWTGAYIENDFLGKHVEPVGTLIASFLTEAWIPAVLAANPNVVIPDMLDLVFRFDAQKLRAQTDTAATAKTLREQGLMNDDAYVAALGFEPSVLPATEEDRIAVLALALVGKAPVTYAPMLTLLGFPDHIVDAILAQAAPPAPGGAASVLGEREQGMLRIAYDRALERAASRILSRLQRNNPAHEAIRTRLQTVPLKNVVSTLRMEDWAALGWLSVQEGVDDVFKDADQILYTANPEFPAAGIEQLQAVLQDTVTGGYQQECFT